MSLGERIKYLRQLNNLSQNDLAQIIGTSQTQIWKYETDKNEPTSGVIIALARALNTSTDYLLGLTDDAERPLETANDLSNKEKAIIRAVRTGRLEDVVKTFMEES